MVETSSMFVFQRVLAATPTLIKTRAARKRFQQICIAWSFACIGALALPD